MDNINYNSINVDAVFNVCVPLSVIIVIVHDIYVGEDAIIKVSLTQGKIGNVTVTIEGKLISSKHNLRNRS